MIDFDEKQAMQRVRALMHTLFVANAEGRELMDLWAKIHVASPVFPQPEAFLAVHGGAACWAAYRDGQLSFVRSVKQLATEYRNEQDKENT